MKKFHLICMAVIMAAGMNACSDSDDEAPLKGNGEKCTASSECRSDFCDASGTCDAKPGTKKGNGEKCTASSECRSDFCDASGTCDAKPGTPECTQDSDCTDPLSPVCEHGRCSAPNPPVPGDPCGDKSFGDSCGINKVCNNLGECVEQPKKPNGTGCSDNAECKSDFCNAGSCADRPVIDKKEDEKPCEHSAECLSNYCNGKKICAHKQTVGNTCSVDEDCISSNCKNSICSSELKAVGDDCDGDFICESKYCNAHKKCAIRAANGEKCENNSDCTDNYCSSDRVCAVRIADGLPCKTDDDCFSGRCADSICTKKINEKTPREIGETCTADVQCYSQKCEAEEGSNEKKCAPGVSTGTRPGIQNGEPCVSASECLSGYCGNDNQCAFPAPMPENEVPNSCSVVGSRMCVEGNQYMTCQQWAATLGYVPTKCPAGTVCATYGEFTDCMYPCSGELVGKHRTQCDPDDIEPDGGFSYGFYTYECQDVGGQYLYVPLGASQCPHGTLCTDDDIICN